MPVKRTLKISTVNLRHSSHLSTKSDHSDPTNVLLPSLTAQATGFFHPEILPQRGRQQQLLGPVYMEKSCPG